MAANFNAAAVAQQIKRNVSDVDAGLIDWTKFSKRQRAAWLLADQGQLCINGSAAQKRVLAVHAALKQLDSMEIA
jgi:hypothetical protein